MDQSKERIIHARLDEHTSETVCGKNHRTMMIAAEQAIIVISADLRDPKINCPVCRERLNWK